jgi:indole-3-glycerol phosphate synthase
MKIIKIPSVNTTIAHRVKYCVRKKTCVVDHIDCNNRTITQIDIPTSIAEFINNHKNIIPENYFPIIVLSGITSQQDIKYIVIVKKNGCIIGKGHVAI